MEVGHHCPKLLPSHNQPFFDVDWWVEITTSLSVTPILIYMGNLTRNEEGMSEGCAKRYCK